MKGKHGSAADLSARSPAQPYSVFPWLFESRHIRDIDSQLNFQSKSLLPPKMYGTALTSSTSLSSLNLRYLNNDILGSLNWLWIFLTSPAKLLLVSLATPSPTDAETCHIAMLLAYLRQILLNLVPTHLFFLTCTTVAPFLSICPTRHPNRPHSQLLPGTAGQFPKTP